jgi:hypothetical protein
MKLLIDQDVYGATIKYLRGLTHDLKTAAELGMAQASDSDLLGAALKMEESWLHETATLAAWYSSRHCPAASFTSGWRHRPSEQCMLNWSASFRNILKLFY